MSAVQREVLALRRLAAKQKMLGLRRRANETAHELRQVAAVVLRYPEARRSVVAIHARDAQHGVRREKFVMRRGVL